MSKQYKQIHCVINGKEREAMVDVRASLTDLLRNDFRLTSVKKGCEVGECGACNVLVNGECFNSCIYLAVWADGKEILTLEGLEGPNGEISDIQQAFIDEAAVQCGFCTPGAIMSAVEILNEGRELSDEEIRKGSPHIDHDFPLFSVDGTFDQFIPVTHRSRLLPEERTP